MPEIFEKVGLFFERIKSSTWWNRISPWRRKAVSDLISMMDPDIKMGFRQDSSGLGFVQAKALSKIGEPAVKPLIEALSITSEAHYALGLIGGGKAFQSLCAELRTKNWRRMTAAVNGLKELDDPRVLPILRKRLEAANLMESFGGVDDEFFKNLRAAIQKLEVKTEPIESLLEVDRANPWDQVVKINGMFHELRDDDLRRPKAIRWAQEFVTVMPTLKFISDDYRGRVWAMLGTMLYYWKVTEADKAGMNLADVGDAEYCIERSLELLDDSGNRHFLNHIIKPYKGRRNYPKTI